MGAFSSPNYGGWKFIRSPLPPYRWIFMGYNGQSRGFVGFSETAVTAQVHEDAGKLRLTVYRTNGWLVGGSAYIRVDWATANGTAIAGTDYTAASGSLIWKDGDITPKTIEIPITKRPTSNASVNFTVSLTAIVVFPLLGGFELEVPEMVVFGTSTVTILRTDYGKHSFTGAAWEVQDPGAGTSTLTLKVQRVASVQGSQAIQLKGAVTCNFHTANGTAIAGTDYTAASGTLSWADGEGGTKDIAITIIGRAGSQGSRSFSVIIDNPVGGSTIGAIPTATATITEGAPASNPPTGADPAQQLDDSLENDGRYLFGSAYVDDVELGSRRVNILFDSVLGEKVGSVIGFGPDFINQDFTLLPTPARRGTAFIW